MRCKLLAITIAASLGALSFGVNAQTADSVNVELAQLKAQLAALQAKVNALQASQTQQTQTMANTQQQVQNTQQQVQYVQATQANQQNTFQNTINSLNGRPNSSAGSFQYKGVNITLGGFLEAAGIYRSRNETADMGSNYAGIPFKNVTNGNMQEYRYSSRQSRFSILAQGDISDTIHAAAYYELDFLGGAQTANSNESNSYQPRTRNVYMTLDWDTPGLHFLGGQNWSLLTLNSKGILPRTEVPPVGVDAQYVPGFAWARQPQLRLVKDWDQKYWLGVSLENPQTTFSSNTSPSPGAGDQIAGGSQFNNTNKFSFNRLPDLIVKAAADPGWGHYELFAIGRSFYNNVNNSARNVYGGGYGLNLLLPLMPKMLEFQFSGMEGRGIGRYGSAQMPDVTLNANGSMQPIKENMLLAGLLYHPTTDLDVYSYLGREEQEKEAFMANGKPYGWGNPLYDNIGCDEPYSNNLSPAAPCAGNNREVWQGTLGFWWKFYQGKFGKVQFGMQYSYTQRLAFQGVGGAPSAKDNMVFTSFRYYPF